MSGVLCATLLHTSLQDMSILRLKTEGSIKNGQSGGTVNNGHTRHRIINVRENRRVNQEWTICGTVNIVAHKPPGHVHS